MAPQYEPEFNIHPNSISTKSYVNINQIKRIKVEGHMLYAFLLKFIDIFNQ